jgi:dienelactone hydrolase|tara:strand:+ start:2109 stop:2855 length:747 start_codon:yes stop_codon:yes gene_type:complete
LARTLPYLLVAIIGISAILGWYLISPTEEKPYNSEEVSFSTPDGIKISATWYFPKELEAPYKTVILSHQFDGDRYEWDPFIGDFIKRGYAILAYDIRGFGKSQDVPISEEYYDTLIGDVEGAVTYLNSRNDVIMDRIGIVGAQLGGTIAYAASGYIDEIKVSVAISPANIGSLIVGDGVETFTPHSILFQFLDTERTSVQPLIEKTEEPKTSRLYRPESPAVRASGISLLHRDLRALTDLLRYLDENL